MHLMLINPIYSGLSETVNKKQDYLFYFKIKHSILKTKLF